MKAKKHIYSLLILLFVFTISSLNAFAAGASLKLSKSTVSLKASGSVTITATVKGASKSVEWSTDNENVAIVVGGKITAISEGVANISATANGITKICRVTVTPQISKTSVTINLSDNYKLSVLGTDKSAVWSSSNINVATVTADGTVVPVNTGKVTIQARIGRSVYKCTVKIVASSIKLNKTALTLYSEDYGTSVRSYLLKATVKGARKTVTWESSDDEIVSVDSKGLLKSHKAGTCIITAGANNVSASCVVTVKDVAVSLNKNELLIGCKGTGNNYKLSIKYTGSSSKASWKTSNKNIATVSNGTVTGIKPGEAYITVTSNGVTDVCHVIVKSGLSLSSQNVTLYTDINDSKTLKTNMSSKTEVIWESDNPEVASVSYGKITPISEGIAIITAKVMNGDELYDSADCLVRVVKTETNIEEDSIVLTNKYSNTAKLSINVVGKSSTKTFSSSNTKVATVSKTGVITAKKPGDCVISLKANQKTDTVTVHVDPYAPRISLSKNSYSLFTEKGNSITLKASVDGPSKTVLWSSLDEEVATVTGNGVVVAKKQGNTVITATANGVSAECAIKVIESEIVLNTESITLDKGKTAELYADITGSSLSYTMTSQNTKVATVTNGLVKAVNYGETDIIIKANNMTKTCHITVETCEHEYVITDEEKAGCTVDGYIVYSCIKCNDSYKETITAAGHEYEEKTYNAPTCVEDGSVLYSCIVCGNEYEDILECTGHAELIYKEIKPADCLSGACFEVSCPKCLEVWTECGEEPDTDNHDCSGDYEVVKEADCCNEGIKIKKCLLCGETVETQIIETTEHELVFLSYIKKPTCENDGVARYNCKYRTVPPYCMYFEETEVPALGHDEVISVYTAPLCEKEGVQRHYCKNNDCISPDVNYFEIIPATGHNMEYRTTVQPSPGEDGYDLWVCTNQNCGKSERRNIVIHEHVWSWKGYTSYSCTEGNTGTYECTVRGCDATKTTVSEPSGHMYKYVGGTETCTEAGERHYKCTNPNCDSEYYENVPATGHAYRYTENVSATCTSSGYYIYICYRCNIEDHRIYSGPRSHDYSIRLGETESTCAEEGYITYGCANCDATTNRATQKKPHTNVWTTVQEPNEQNNGIYEERCSECNRLNDTRIVHAYKTYTITFEDGHTEDIYGWLESEYSDSCLEGDNPYLDSNCMSGQVFRLLNEYRLENGLNELIWNSSLQKKADYRAVEASAYFSHTRPDGSEWHTIGIPAGGENLGLRHKDAETVMTGWKNSEGHNENMLRARFKYVGIGTFHRLIFEENSPFPKEEYKVWSQLFIG